jgi:hypothetical protein
MTGSAGITNNVEVKLNKLFLGVRKRVHKVHVRKSTGRTDRVKNIFNSYRDIIGKPRLGNLTTKTVLDR